MVRRRKAPVQIFFRKAPNPDQIAERLARVNLSASGGANLIQGNGPWIKFEDMKLKEKLMKGILAYGLEKPALIQQQAIVPLIRGKDSVLQAQSGMGKTAALCIGILERIDLSDQSCQALVVVPTRELALQITSVFQELSKFMGIKCISCVGGTGLKIDKEALSLGGVSIVVGTLGKICHLADEDFLTFDTIRMFALDEADKMLTDPSFKRDICKLLNKYVEGDTQIILMSATMPPVALFRTKELLINPAMHLISNEDLTLEGIRQYHISLDEDGQKIDTLCELMTVIGSRHTLVFCNTRKLVKELVEKLKARGGSIFSSTHGELEQARRLQALKSFRRGESRLLITSDLLGRGIDVQQVSVVINFDLPKHKEEYIHRVGRGGRYGKKGIAITFITNSQVDDLNQIAKFYNTDIPPMPITVFQ